MLFGNQSRQAFNILGRNIAAASFSNGLGLGIGFHVSGCFGDPSESHKPILLISEIFTDG